MQLGQFAVNIKATWQFPGFSTSMYFIINWNSG